MVHRAPSDFLLASEEVVTRSVGRKKAPPAVRVNVFSPPAVLIGCHQYLHAEVNLEKARERGFDINRRCTGGGAILMYDDTPGWEIWVPEEFVRGLSIEQMYEELSKPVVYALRELGVDAKFRPKNDIEVSGRKISGMGVYTEAGGVMLCGTLLLDFDLEAMLEVLKLPIEKISDKAIRTFEERITTVARETGRKPSIDEVRRLVREGVEREFGVELVDADLAQGEREELRETIKKYRSDEWIYGERDCSSFARSFVAKTPGGLFRVYAKVVEGVIESVVITGDFFAYPPGVVLDVEASLKWTRADRESVLEAVRSALERKGGYIMGVSAEDLADLVLKACGATS